MINKHFSFQIQFGGYALVEKKGKKKRKIQQQQKQKNNTTNKTNQNKTIILNQIYFLLTQTELRMEGIKMHALGENQRQNKAKRGCSKRNQIDDNVFMLLEAKQKTLTNQTN